VTEVVDDGKGALFSKVVKVIPDVNQTLGYDQPYSQDRLAGSNRPGCKKYRPIFAVRAGRWLTRRLCEGDLLILAFFSDVERCRKEKTSAGGRA
jgi:hypothetical protein